MKRAPRRGCPKASWAGVAKMPDYPENPGNPGIHQRSKSGKVIYMHMAKKMSQVGYTSGNNAYPSAFWSPLSASVKDSKNFQYSATWRTSDD